MKSKEVLNFLNISRVTLTKYVKNGTIKVTKLDNGIFLPKCIQIEKIILKLI